MKIWAGLFAGASCALVIACAAGPAAPPRSAPSPAASHVNDAHAQIEALDRAIDDELASRGLPAAAPPACGAGSASCAAPTADQMSAGALVAPPPTCHPGPSDRCKDTCTLGDAICSNAGKICDLAKQLADDPWANEKCAKGTSSCEAARGRCCACQV